MKDDVYTAFLQKKMPRKRPSKETLNHTALIYLASGINPHEDTQQAYLAAYRSLGIDVFGRVPSTRNALPRLSAGQSEPARDGYTRAHLGLYDTYFRDSFPFASVEEFWAATDWELDYNALITPVPHRLDLELIREKIALAGDIGQYYYMYYTTLFMWGVEFLGWEIFLLAAALEPEKFATVFLEKALAASRRDLALLTQADYPFLFVHDDLAQKSGPVFAPEWYDEYIFPHYPTLWQPALAAGKKIIFVADGNMASFLRPLRQSGVSGVMLENPATDLAAVLDVFADGIIFGGMDTSLLTFGTPAQIRQELADVCQMTRDVPGFALGSPGGLHDNIPLDNLIAYFDARTEYGFTEPGWQKGDLATARAFFSQSS